jgi:putative hydrolase of the HAD superfamily
VLPRVIERFNLSVRLEDLVAAYRTHTPEIRLYAGYEGLLREFRKKYRIGIVTDGIPEVQQRKCRALGLAGAVDSIVCTWEYGKEKEKPHPHSFRLILGSLRVQPAEALFIGDSMEKDCRGAHDAGMKCALVARQPGVRSVPGAGEADFVIGSLFQLPQVLRQLEDRNEAA